MMENCSEVNWTHRFWDIFICVVDFPTFFASQLVARSKLSTFVTAGVTRKAVYEPDIRIVHANTYIACRHASWVTLPRPSDTNTTYTAPSTTQNPTSIWLVEPVCSKSNTAALGNWAQFWKRHLVGKTTTKMKISQNLWIRLAPE